MEESLRSERSRLVLQAIVEEYVSQGQPVASKKLSERADLPLSSATIRNVMADLEEQGYLKSPHTSAGRVPTDQGYRYFVNHLAISDAVEDADLTQWQRRLDPNSTVGELVQSASGLLAEITQLAGLATKPKPALSILRHIEFLPLAGRRVLAILVFNDHEVEHRVLHVQGEHSSERLKESSNYINAHYAGCSLGTIRARILKSMQGDQRQIDELTQMTLKMAELFFQHDEEDVLVAGQERLIDTIHSDQLDDLRKLYRALSLKEELLILLDRCLDAQGVKLFIGPEAGSDPLEDCALIASPYHMNGSLVGVLGVIGPTRMAYNRVIPLVQATAQSLSLALTQR
jgi:heat-inducible transcriptional repressor